MIITLVLSTDMAEHFNILSEFQSKVQAPMAALYKADPSIMPPTTTLNGDQKLLVMKMSIKCADIGHTTLAPDVHSTWVESMQEEFYRQVRRGPPTPTGPPRDPRSTPTGRS